MPQLVGLNCVKSEYNGEVYFAIEEIHRTPWPTTEEDEIRRGQFEERVKTSKTHQSYINLINQSSDIILVASLPSEEELNMAEEKGVKLVATPIAKDAFIFLNHEENPITNLSSDQIKDIYSGRITNWKDVGGDDLAISAYTRNANS